MEYKWFAITVSVVVGIWFVSIFGSAVYMENVKSNCRIELAKVGRSPSDIADICH